MYCKNTWGSYECTCYGENLCIREHDTCISMIATEGKSAWIAVWVILIGLAMVAGGAYMVYKYRLRVRWGETSSTPRPDTILPWKIEPALSPPELNPLPVPRQKRPRSNLLPYSPDSSVVLTREGSSKVVADPLPLVGFSRVTQVQEISTLGANFAESIESDLSDKQVIWSHFPNDEKIDVPTSIITLVMLVNKSQHRVVNVDVEFRVVSLRVVCNRNVQISFVNNHLSVHCKF